MKNELTLPFLVHIIVGSIALLCGALALIFQKGSQPHRLSGKVFAASMAFMSVTGVYLAIIKPAYISIVAGALTLYLVATSWLTIRQPPGLTNRYDLFAIAFAVFIVVGSVLFGVNAANSELGYHPVEIYGIFPGVYFAVAGITGFCLLLDIRMVIAGGVRGAHRIARHLWRMCFALFIAAASIFIGNPQVFPDFSYKPLILAVPVMLIFFITIYWLMRTLFFNRIKQNGSQA